MFSHAPTVLLLAADRDLLRRTTRLLQKCGYQTLPAAQTQTGLSALKSALPDIVVCDPERLVDLDDLWKEISQQRRSRRLRVLQLVEHGDIDLMQSLEAGVDDFLEKPLVLGELLARLQAAARSGELERRLAEQSCWDPVTGLRTEFGLRRVLAQASWPLACVAIELDYYDGMPRRHGQEAADALLRAVAQWLQDQDPTHAGYLGRGRFAVLWEGRSPEQILEWAEDLRRGLCELHFNCGGEQERFTASAGTSGAAEEAGQSDEPLRQALAALEYAKISGRNLVSAWIESARQTAGGTDVPMKAALAGTTAHHVMTPCVAVLYASQTVSDAQDLLAQTGVPVVPVVDEAGRLLATLRRKDLPVEEEQLLSQCQLPEEQGVDEHAPLEELMGEFLSGSSAFKIVVRDGEPIGYITRRQLAGLVDPVRPESFQAATPQLSTDYLLIEEPSVSNTG